MFTFIIFFLVFYYFFFMFFQYSACLLLFFVAELAIATFGFVFPQKVTGILEKHLTTKLIESYRDDPDLQNIIDFTQQEVLKS